MPLKIYQLIILLMSAAASAAAQNNQLKGHVLTSDGASAEGVTIVLGKHNTTTDNKGNFTLRNIKAGTYQLVASFVHHQPIEQTIRIAEGETTMVELRLEWNKEELEAVLVSAKKSNYNVVSLDPTLRIQGKPLEIAQNIQIVSNRTLQSQQIISMSDGVLKNISGAMRQEHWGDLYTNVKMRGGQLHAFANGFNMVTSPWGPLTEDMSIVDHIEFVKGPAGFMLSYGDPAGFYNVVTKKPTGAERGAIDFTAGSFNLMRIAADYDGVLSKNGKILYRMNAAAQKKGSHRTNEFNDRYTIAPVMKFKLNDRTQLTAEYNLQLANMSDVGSYYIFSPTGYKTLPVETTQLPAGLPATKIADQRVYLQFEHQLSENYKLTAQTMYNSYNSKGSSLWPDAINSDGSYIRSAGIWDTKSTLAMMQAFINGESYTGNVRHRILAGIDAGEKKYYADWTKTHRLDTSTWNPLTQSGSLPTAGYPDWDRSKPVEQRATLGGGTNFVNYSGIYIQDELGFLNNNLRITIAGRYTSFSQAMYGGAALKVDKITPRFGISYSITPSTSVYGVLDQSVIPQTGLMADNSKVKPITGTNTELGFKRDWAGGSWSSTLAVYRIVRRNELTADPNSPPNSGRSVSLGEKTARGVELDIRGTLATGLHLIANYAYTENYVSKVTPGVTAFAKGQQIPGFAKNTYNATVRYQLPVPALKGIGAQASFSYLEGRSTYSLTNDPSRNMEDYHRMDAAIFWENHQFGVQLQCYNLFNQYLYTGGYYDFLNSYYWQTEPRRNFRLSVHYNF
jgi:iron complex outermembrane receptor protein